MEVILVEKVGRLGNVGDKVSVKSGYGRNFLIPQGKAIFASAENVARLEQRRAELESVAAARLAAAEVRAQRLAELPGIVIKAVAGEEGKLFGSVGSKDIASALTAAGVEIAKGEVRMPAGAIRELGVYAIDIQVHADLSQVVQVTVAPE